jgi:hypothetical protein
VRGYGFSPNGSVDRVRSFLAQLTFLLDDAQVEDTEAFLMAAEAELAPIVGQQVTIARESPERAFQRLELLLQRAATPRPFRDVPGARECDLVARGRLGGAPRGWLWREEAFRSDRRWEPPWSLDALLASTRRWGGEITFTCVPPGAGERMGLDRDGDGALDGDELWARSDPADPTSVPGRARFGLRER